MEMEDNHDIDNQDIKIEIIDEQDFEDEQDNVNDDDDPLKYYYNENDDDFDGILIFCDKKLN
jgi:hypothetical protein